MTPHPDALLHAERIRTYLARLQACDAEGLAAMFTDDAEVVSPFLGTMHPRPFFAKLREASGASRIETIDIFASAGGAPRAIGYFAYHWGLKDGSQVRFDCCDVFDFTPDGRFTRMTIVYDTHPIREQVGDKYA